MSQFKEELIIIRHARTFHNIRETEDMDSSLTPWGFRQAGNVGHFLANHMHLEGFWFYTSPFWRCLQTSKEIQKHLPGKQFCVNPVLREYINHSGDSVEIPERSEQYPEFFWYLYKEAQVFHKEHNEGILSRMTKAFDHLPEKSVVVTHGIPALMLLQIATSRDQTVPVWDNSLDNASITRIVNGRVIWRGRNLHHEVDGDVYARKHGAYEGDVIK